MASSNPGDGAMNGPTTAAVTQPSHFSSFLMGLGFRKIPEQLIQMGDNAVAEGNNDDALRHYNEALRRERRTHHGNDVGTLREALILNKIGWAQSRIGDSFEAMNSLEDALRIQQERLGPGSEDAAATTAQMNRILDEIRVQSGVGERKFVKGDDEGEKNFEVGTNLLEWGDYKEAEVVLKECLKSMDDNKDSQNDRIKVLGAMAELDRAQGKYDEAKKRYLEVLRTAKEMNATSDDKVDSSIINSIAGYAEILRKAGDLLQAEALHRKVRNMLMASRYSQDSEVEETDTVLQLAISHTQLGCTVFALRKYDDAWHEHKSALNIRLKMLEVTDALVSESFNYCAETLSAIGRSDAALPFSLQAVEIRAREFGTAHPAYAHALCVLSKCYLGVGRAHDSLPLIQRCLEICESVFTENHANIIPNLCVLGDVLKANGELEKALTVYEKALSIHNMNFKPGQNEFELEECHNKMEECATALMDRSFGQKCEIIANSREQIQPGGTPIIVISDIGRDIDDVLAIAMLSSLRKMCILNPLAIIVTLPPEEDRACLARTVLDSLGMHDTIVGVGENVVYTGEIGLKCFEGIYQQKPFEFESSSSLIKKLLAGAESKSVKIVCLANLKDVSALIVKEKVLFCAKVKELIVMGGATYSEQLEKVIPDLDASNNSCEIKAARHVYAECQQSQIPTTTISRFAAYGCPLSHSWLDGLRNTNHLLATEIRNTNFKAMQQLWKKVNMSPWMPGRRGLPSRCNREWFLDFFKVRVDETTDTLKEIWQDSALYLYDSLAILAAVDPYLEVHFTPERHKVENTYHRIIGTQTSSCVADKVGLVNEMKGLLHQTFELSIRGVEIGMESEICGDAEGSERTESSDNSVDFGDFADEKKEANSRGLLPLSRHISSG